MTGAQINNGPVLVVVLVVLLAIATVTVWAGGVGSWRAVSIAGVRAAAQLALVSTVIAAILRSDWWTAGFVSLMFAVAMFTSGRRSKAVRGSAWTGLSIAAGVVPVLGLVLATGVVPWRPIAVVPIAGIVIGGAMTATSQATRRALDELRDRRGEYEAALALGFAVRAAALEICRPTAGQALIPPLDQTRTVGLVTLPGAFVGMLLGGAGPVQAGVAQLLVLIGLLAAESLAVVVSVELVAIGRIQGRKPAESAV